MALVVIKVVIICLNHLVDNITRALISREILKFHTICRYLVRNKIMFWSASYSACVVYTKTFINRSKWR